MDEVYKVHTDPQRKFFKGDRIDRLISVEKLSPQVDLLLTPSVIKTIDDETSTNLVGAWTVTRFFQIIDVGNGEVGSEKRIWVDEISVKEAVIGELDRGSAQGILSDELFLLLEDRKNQFIELAS